jgi:hypothetical protein
MNRQGFLGPTTIAVAAGMPPMGSVFTTVPLVDYRPTIDPQQGLPRIPSRAPLAPGMRHKIRLLPKALCWDCSA